MSKRWYPLARSLWAGELLKPDCALCQDGHEGEPSVHPVEENQPLIFCIISHSRTCPVRRWLPTVGFGSGSFPSTTVPACTSLGMKRNVL